MHCYAEMSKREREEYALKGKQKSEELQKKWDELKRHGHKIVVPKWLVPSEYPYVSLSNMGLN